MSLAMMTTSTNTSDNCLTTVMATPIGVVTVMTVMPLAMTMAMPLTTDADDNNELDNGARRKGRVTEELRIVLPCLGSRRAKSTRGSAGVRDEPKVCGVCGGP